MILVKLLRKLKMELERFKLFLINKIFIIVYFFDVYILFELLILEY